MLSHTAALLVFMNKFINSLLELLGKRYKLKCATNYQLQNIPYSGWAFWGLLTDGGGWSLPKICNAYPTMMKLGTVTPYLKKILKIYESRGTTLEFC